MPFHKLDVYRKAYELSLAIHRESLRFPRFEQYELASQVRRSTKSICANMAEGLGRLLADSDLRERLAGRARERAEEFSAGRMAEKLVRVYERALAGRTPGSAGR